MEIGGFTGDRLWLIVAVVLFNLVCLLLWFIVGALRRTQSGSLAEARTFIELMRREVESQRLAKARRAELEQALTEAEAKLQEGEDLGPLWGRRALTNANLLLHGIADRFPEVSDPVNEQMVGEG